MIMPDSFPPIFPYYQIKAPLPVPFYDPNFSYFLVTAPSSARRRK
jgi:hypothetical protein